MTSPSSYNLLKFALFLFIALNIALLVKIRRSAPQTAEAKETNVLRDKLILNNLFFQMESEGAALDGSLMLESESGEIFCLAEIVSAKPMLFLRYSELHCNMCVDHGLNYLKALADSVGSENIAILASYNNIRELAVFIRINQIPCRVYRIPEEGTGLPAENHGFPYLFMTDNSLRARHFHVPNKDIPELTGIFLSVVPQLYREMKMSLQHNPIALTGN